MWLVEDNGWRLDLEDRSLDFLFTPYVHFPGAFCTFDPVSQVLFSSDLFGGFSDADRIFAESTDDFDDVRIFHEHYMPGREFLTHALEQLHVLLLRAKAHPVRWWNTVTVGHEVDEAVAQVAHAVKHEP